MAEPFVVGDKPLISHVFHTTTGVAANVTQRDGSVVVVLGAAADPTTVTLTVSKPDGSSASYTYAGATVTKFATGVYDKQDFTADQAGEYVAVWTSTGPGADVAVARFSVGLTNDNLYCTPEEMKSRFRIGDADDDVELWRACRASSRRVESFCGRERFWRDAAVVDRVFEADSPCSLRVPEGVSTLTGLVVKTDEDGDGTFERTLTISTDFLLKPHNNLAKTPAWPYDQVEIVGNSSYRFPHLYGRPSVQITARFGWPAIPDDVAEAALILAHRLFKRKESENGVVGIDGMGATVRLSRTDPDVAGLLAPYVVFGIA